MHEGRGNLRPHRRVSQALHRWPLQHVLDELHSVQFHKSNSDGQHSLCACIHCHVVVALGEVEIPRQAQTVGVHVRQVEHGLRILRLRGGTVVAHRRLGIHPRAEAVEVVVAELDAGLHIPLLRGSGKHIQGESFRVSHGLQLGVLHATAHCRVGDVRGVGLRHLESALRESRVEEQGSEGIGLGREGAVPLLKVGAPLAALCHCLEELRRCWAGPRRPQPVEVHLPEVIERERVALVSGEGEVVQRLVVGFLDASA
mmetsp:Transcript_8836/g.24411  ORF Transcript_8836/g.24411 Transcript_8836/m.24411 type:complete len:257 (+) Transcript_8836:432-1202(+)